MDVLGPMGGAMSEAQKRLYKTLLKNIDDGEEEDDELAKLSSQKMTPAEIYERRLRIERKNEEMLRAKAERNLARKQEKEEFKKKIREEKTRKREMEQRKKIKEEADKRIMEVELKTHQFFRLNAYGKPQNTGVVYFGDCLRDGDAWIPHGEGEYRVSGEVLYEGSFNMGKMHGQGSYLFGNRDSWVGTFRFDELHGVGVYKKYSGEDSGSDSDDEDRRTREQTKKDFPPRECIYHNNKRVCFTEELLPGIHIILIGGTFHSPGATILGKGKKRGHFKAKMDIGGQQNLNLAEESFAIDTRVPRITLLENYVPKKGECGSTKDGTAIENRYDYLKEVEVTDHGENWFSDKLPPTTEADKLVAEEAKKKEAEWKAKKDKLAANKTLLANREEVAAAKKLKEQEESEKRVEKEKEEAELARRRAGLIEERASRQTMLQNQSRKIVN